MTYYWETDRSALGSVYGALLGALTGNNRDDADNAEPGGHQHGSKRRPGTGGRTVGGVRRRELYRIQRDRGHGHRTIPMPVDLSFVGFPSEIPVTVTSTAVVQNGDEFVRNMDLARDLTLFLAEKFNLTDMLDGVAELGRKFTGFLGI